MSLQNIFKKEFSISFEIFPPKTDMGVTNLFKELDVLKNYNPSFISITYGAGGSTQSRTFDLALKIKELYNIDPVVHFTCVAHSQEEIKEYLTNIKKHGINNILALRGDPPKGEKEFIAPENGFHYANELVEFISSLDNFNIAVAGYPEGHIEAPDYKTDIENLKRKVDAGANAIITQLFFDNNDFYKFLDATQMAGINVPIIPGILPVSNIAQIEKVTKLCGAKVPQDLVNALSKCSTDEQYCEAGIEYSIKQCEELKKWGVSGFHFYPLNKSYSTKKILDELGLR